MANQVQRPLTPQMKSACIFAVVADFVFLRVKVTLVRVFVKFRGRPPPAFTHTTVKQVPCASGALSKAGLWVLSDTELN